MTGGVFGKVCSWGPSSRISLNKAAWSPLPRRLTGLIATFQGASQGTSYVTLPKQQVKFEHDIILRSYDGRLTCSR